MAVSRDRGVSWHYAAHVEREETDGVRIHYPSLLQHGQYLYVMYSRFYLDLGRCKTMADKLACRGVGSSNQVRPVPPPTEHAPWGRERTRGVWERAPAL